MFFDYESLFNITKMSMLKKISLFLCVIVTTAVASGQSRDAASDGLRITQTRVDMSRKNLLPKFALKTNLLYDATTTFNLGMEFGLGRRTTLDISGNYNPWTFSNNRKFKHWMVQPEFRVWTCERFNGGFFGIHAFGGEMNIGGWDLPFGLYPNLKNHRYEGWFIGAGISYGYQWYLGPHWNLEATVGVGYLRFDYDRFDCVECGEKLGSGVENYFGPTKLGLSLIYLFKYKK